MSEDAKKPEEMATIDYAPPAENWMDKKAEFKFFPSGEIIEEGIPFDTPDSKWVRSHDKAAYEIILADKQINDPALIEIGKIIHDLEINLWYLQYPKQSGDVKLKLGKIIEENRDPFKCLEKSFEFFDALYASLRKKASRGDGEEEGTRHKGNGFNTLL